jgi:hypothetical protein
MRRTGTGRRRAKPALIFSCREDNDLCRVMIARSANLSRFENPAEAVRAAGKGAGILILADEYPQKTTIIEPGVFAEAAEKKLRLYVEYPSALPGITVGPVCRSTLERVVATSDVFGNALKRMQLVAIHDCHFVQVACAQPHLMIARVAGFDRAMYGLSNTAASPILFEHPDGNILVATTKLSQFVTARYGPQERIQAILRMVLGWLQPKSKPPSLNWIPTVRPSFGRDETLPHGAAHRALLRGMDWHTHARMLLGEKGSKVYQRKYSQTPPEVVAPLPDRKWAVGNGHFGILEGTSSRIHFDGTQPARWWLRSDCNGESALPFALRWKLDGDMRSRDVAVNLLDWLYLSSGLFENDPAKANYGLLYWARDSMDALYHDNDVKAILGCLGAAAALNTDRWDEVLIKNILANFRTTGIYGFRGQRLSNARLCADGWQAAWHAETVMLQPHYEAWIWATYLWLYARTGFKPLLTRTRHAIRMMMEAYPARWGWTNGFQQERGRMLLPLAWLIRVDDRPEHRAWLRQIVGDIARYQDACGAIREELGPPEQGTYRPTPSNAEYGKNEAPLIHENGDPVADLLYTCNFAFFGLHEAEAATGDPQCRRIADRLADFLVRAQIRSEAHPELNGGWFRAFDYRRWEYWGSNADMDWGAWCIEVGWTQGWISSTLALREMGTNLWDMTSSIRLKKRFELIRKRMLPDEILNSFKAGQ